MIDSTYLEVRRRLSSGTHRPMLMICRTDTASGRVVACLWINCHENIQVLGRELSPRGEAKHVSDCGIGMNCSSGLGLIRERVIDSAVDYLHREYRLPTDWARNALDENWNYLLHGAE